MTKQTAATDDLLLEALTSRLEAANEMAVAAPLPTLALQRRRWAALQAKAHDIAALARSLEILTTRT